MLNNKGKIIVIDGLDGSGKSTQFELVQKELEKRNIKFKSISFPEYDKPSSTLVKMYLNGEFSKNAEDVNAYASSSFYAVDRYASFKIFWEKYFNEGELILASRYISSNAIHQMVKLEKNQWDSYLEWLYDYEVNKLGLPNADKVIFLDMPVEISQELLKQRYNGDESKKDIHEADVQYLKNCRNSALYASAQLDWKIIQCSNNNLPLPVDTILEKIMHEILEVL